MAHIHYLNRLRQKHKNDDLLWRLKPKWVRSMANNALKNSLLFLLYSMMYRLSQSLTEGLLSMRSFEVNDVTERSMVTE